MKVIGQAISIALAIAAMTTGVEAGPIADKARQAEELLDQGRPNAALQNLEDAVDLAWTAMPLILRKTIFVQEPANGYGLYVPKTEANFSAGEKLRIYVEPVGYGYGQTGAGSLSIGFDVDFTLTDPTGKVLYSKDDFVEIGSVVRYRNREFFLNMSVSLTGVPGGEYRADFRLRDQNSDKSATFSLPFAIGS